MHLSQYLSHAGVTECMSTNLPHLRAPQKEIYMPWVRLILLCKIGNRTMGEQTFQRTRGQPEKVGFSDLFVSQKTWS